MINDVNRALVSFNAYFCLITTRKPSRTTAFLAENGF